MIPLKDRTANLAGIAAFAEALEKAGLTTFTQLRALILLGQAGSMDQSELAKAVGKTGACATMLRDRLEKAGLVKSSRSLVEGFRREVTTSLSVGGKRLLDSALSSAKKSSREAGR